MSILTTLNSIQQDIISLREDIHQIHARPNLAGKMTHRLWIFQQLEAIDELTATQKQELAGIIHIPRPAHFEH
jgi:hypothetical protein